jgi:DNA-binding NarL/FixJ family response regulator
MNKIQLLIADDHKIFIEGLMALLEKEKDIHVMKTFLRGDELLEYLGKNPSEKCLLILDINLPGVHGIEVLNKLQSMGKKPKVIVLSMHDQPYIIKQAMKKGAYAYLLKDSGYKEIIDCIRLVNEDKALGKKSSLKSEKPGTDKHVFSLRELEILKLLQLGHSSKEIASELNISFNTVQTHRKNLLRKSGTNTTLALVKFYQDHFGKL